MSKFPKSKGDVPLENSIPEGTVLLRSILCTGELHCRPSRPPDYVRENRALAGLVGALADSPQTILETLAQTILEVTGSDSSGLSLLTKDDGGKRFYWPAIAGKWNEPTRHSVSIHEERARDLSSSTRDRVQLQQVLMNLMLNGIEAMKEVNSPGKLVIKSQQDENRQLLVSVTDTGVGIRPEQIEQIFNAFFTSKPQGTGMGFPISRSIIESHGGHLWVTANSGPSTTFKFTLPLEVIERLVLS